MSSLNRVILMGNLTRDVVLQYLPSGTAIAEIGLAVNERTKRGEEWIEETTFVDVILCGKTAETADKCLGKGSSVMVEGRLRFEAWQQNGQKRSKLKVVCDRMQLMSASREAKFSDPTDELPRPRQRAAARKGRVSSSLGERILFS